jgi:hypothetical protein
MQQALCQDGQQLVLVGAVGGGMEPLVTQSLVQCSIVSEANPQEHAQGPVAVAVALGLPQSCIESFPLRVHILELVVLEEVEKAPLHMLLKVSTIVNISR